MVVVDIFKVEGGDVSWGGGEGGWVMDTEVRDLCHGRKENTSAMGDAEDWCGCGECSGLQEGGWWV